MSEHEAVLLVTAFEMAASTAALANPDSVTGERAGAVLKHRRAQLVDLITKSNGASPTQPPHT